MSRSFSLRVLDGHRVLRIEGITSLVAGDASGQFGIEAGHADFITVLEPGLLRWRIGEGGEWQWAACTGGMLRARSVVRPPVRPERVEGHAEEAGATPTVRPEPVEGHAAAAGVTPPVRPELVEGHAYGAQASTSSARTEDVGSARTGDVGSARTEDVGSARTEDVGSARTDRVADLTLVTSRFVQDGPPEALQRLLDVTLASEAELRVSTREDQAQLEVQLTRRLQKLAQTAP